MIVVLAYFGEYGVFFDKFHLYDSIVLFLLLFHMFSLVPTTLDKISIQSL